MMCNKGGFKMSTRSDRIAGKVKEFAGKATNNKRLELEGKLQNNYAKARQHMQGSDR